MARRRHGFTNTKFRWPREAVSLVLTDRRKLGVQPRRGANHTGIAVASEHWFYTHANLHKNTPARRTTCIPRPSCYIVEKSEHPCNFNIDYINAVKTDEARQQGRTWLAQSHVLSGTCTDEDTGFAAAHTTHTIIIVHGEHEAKKTKTTTRLNRRYLAEQLRGSN